MYIIILVTALSFELMGVLYKLGLEINTSLEKETQFFNVENDYNDNTTNY